MKNSFSYLRTAAPIVIGCAVLVGIVGIGAASSQTMSAAAKSAPSTATEDEVKSLRRQLSLLTDRVTELEKPKGDVPKDDSESDARLKKLEQRVAALQAEGGGSGGRPGADGKGTTFTAPFTIVNSEGNPIMKVYQGDGGRQGLSVRNARGNPVATLWEAVDGSGQIAAFDGESASGGTASKVIVLGYGGGKPELRLGDGDGVRSTFTANTWTMAVREDTEVAQLSAGSTGESGLLMLSRDGAHTAGLGGTVEGGAIKVFDASGATRAQMLASNGFTAYSATGQVLTELGGVASGNNGRLWIGNASGQALIEAGMLVGGKGIIRAGPQVGGAPAGLVMPDRIVGHL